MNRAERRATKSNKKPATYNLTIEQINSMVKERMKDEIEQAKQDGQVEALALMFCIPLEVLKDHYWQKSYEKRLPQFTNYILKYYEQWLNGQLDINKLKDDLWEHGGVRLEVKEELI